MNHTIDSKIISKLELLLNHINDEDYQPNFIGKKFISQRRSLFYDMDSKIYQCQIDITRKIILDILNDHSKFFIEAPTQSGKTLLLYCILKCIIIFKEINPRNIFLLTGLSSKDWKEQMISRFPIMIHNNIVHLNELKKKKKKIKKLKNVLIFIDEAHIASKGYQTLHNFLSEYTPTFIKNNNIKIFCISATLKNLYNTLKNYKFHFMEPDIDYTSIYDFDDQKRIREAKDLTYEKNINNLINHIKDIENDNGYLYHFIRLSNKKIIKLNDYLEKNNFICNTIKYDQKYKNNINDILADKPKITTFVFVINKLRCSISLDKKYIGIMYDTPINESINGYIQIQSFLGRATGYNVPKQLIIYSNIAIIKDYIDHQKKIHTDPVFTESFENEEKKYKDHEMKNKTFQKKKEAVEFIKKKYLNVRPRIKKFVEEPELKYPYMKYQIYIQDNGQYIVYYLE